MTVKLKQLPHLPQQKIALSGCSNNTSDNFDELNKTLDSNTDSAEGK